MNDAADVCEVVITAPDAEWMSEFARHLIAERLVAAVHLFAPIMAIYRWDDTVHQKSEISAAFHTRRSLVPAILNQVRYRHPFEVPGVIILPILEGPANYLEWIYSETGDPNPI
ncbi:divalent-cation tolerance protein CutA [Frankia sp. AgB1.9]|uniref:divalent-cation tolerance protein CutA n=1 Tax=unclassified Frankia TaxID=2632575 RepID=UPI001932E5EA|nr:MULTISPECIES: divalent-cation tolerance protein CutA [unclassified Frankia]MBL7494476.1 divalent-cation tolerance protein CutA [Frankia sp. AgW1.1]MBL7550984.1 divalent-cation tolerance protein CutA [Frankia sp. AgB1.9]MBL7623628.1 divalent-cation tolerance protein CutA [Frankia sp. AgB1.8]